MYSSPTFDARTTHVPAFYKLIRTDAGLAPALARFTLGLVMFPHAAQKAFGWFGGHGFSGTMAAFSKMMPAPLAAMVIVTELVCSVALLLGVFTRLAAVGIAAIMLGAIFMVHVPHGFFMNWYGQQQGEGFEYHLLAMGLCAVAFILGGGLGSIDRALTRRHV
jgi:putative oxidoreductase